MGCVTEFTLMLARVSTQAGD
ncbi:hypothetical protein BN11_410004 [Nostocoides australiense Ben110]|uniref:Uncharacterized protein n=1 Tax=Nostocoides australiense Ben110 TaxID=1193182 RepID=W6JZL3_9MICO|nr:hypothetical protein BN11_410004 [Tetrasphaera australiensis Ben110]